MKNQKVDENYLPGLRRSSSVFRIVSILIISAFLFSTFCVRLQPGTSPTATGALTLTPAVSATPTSPPVTPSPTPFTGLGVLDDGSPLPPRLIDSSPVEGEMIAVQGESINLSFDQAMDQGRTTSALKMTSPEGESVAGEVTWSDPRTLQFTPKDSLVPGEVYRLSLSTGATSAQGIAISDELQLQFETASPLQVSQVFPADGANGVENNAVITVIFNRPVVPLVIAEDQAGLPSPLEIDPPLPGAGEWVNTSVYAYRPEGVLKGSTTYTVQVKAGLSDVSGETSLEKPFSWQFTTLAPSIEAYWLFNSPNDYWEYNPRSYESDVAPDAFFKLTFYQPMDRGSVESALEVVSSNGEPARIHTLWNDENTQVIITPTQVLSVGTDYKLLLAVGAQAADGGILDEGVTWNFHTFPFPQVVAVSPNNGSRQADFDGNLQISFASPMRIDTLKGKVSITPAPAEEPNWFYGSWDNTYSCYCLEPSTSYEIVIQPGMQDLYGNTIQEGKTVRFTTGPRSPAAHLSIPFGGPAMYRAGGEDQFVEFYAGYTNVRTINFKLYRLPAVDFFQMSASYNLDLLPDSAQLVWDFTENSSGALNERVLKRFRPLTADGKSIPPGFYFLVLDSPQVSHPYSQFLDSRLVMVLSANLTLKTTNTEALVWITDFNSGKPLPNLSVTIYDEKDQPVGHGQTDGDGLLYVTDLSLNQDLWAPVYAIAEGDGYLAVSQNRWGSGVSSYDFGIWQEYYAQPNQPRAYVYTDRPLYRPGQPVYFKGIVRIDDDLAYSLPDVAKVKVTISSFEETIFEESLPLSSFGSFEGQITLDQEAALGSYSIVVKMETGDVEIGSVNFGVAEYRKPEYLVTVTATPKDVLGGETFDAAIQADYYSGGPLLNATVDWTLTASAFNFQPPADYSGYSFTDFERDNGVFSEDYYFYSSEMIANGRDQTDENGHLVLTLPADLTRFKTSMQFTLEATVSDLSGNSVSERDSVIAHRAGLYPGVRPSTYVGEVGKPQSFDLVALDWDGKPLGGQQVDVTVVERRWYSVQQQDINGRISWSSSVEEIPVEDFTGVVLDDRGQGSVAFTPSKGGVYLARVTAQDSKGNQAIASAYLWVAGEEFIPWRQNNDRSFDLMLDRDQYVPGDTAEVLIASPFQGEAYALVTVERGHVQYRQVLHLQNNSLLYRLPITAAMAPKAYVSVLIMKGVDEYNLYPDFRMSMAPISVDLGQQKLTVEVVPDKTQASPGEQVQYSIHTLDANGNPVSAEVSLSLSDLAALSLVGPNTPPILDYFYNERGLSVWTAVPLVYSLDFYNAELAEKAVDQQGGLPAGSGGGKGGGDEGVIQVRGNFPDTAYWNAFVTTDSQGQASVSVTLPDNLTTWRMDARAVTQDTLVGQVTQDLVSTKPLLVRPQTPRFFTQGDQAILGAAVHNNTGADQLVDVTLDINGVVLGADATQSVEIADGHQAYVTWPVTVAPGVTRVDMIFSAQGGGFQDASRPPLGTLDNQGIPVYRYDVPETVGTSGQMMSGGTLIEAISLPPSLDVKQGELTIQVAPSLAAAMTDSLTYLEEYPYSCVEQTISRFLPNVFTTRALQGAGLSDPQLEANLETQVSTALQRLYNWQNPDGGWGWWGNQESSLLTSAYVVLGLVEAQKAGYAVSQDALDRGLAYLDQQTLNLDANSQPYQYNRQAFALYVLADAGEADVSASVKLYDDRQKLDLYARAFLAFSLYRIDANDPRLDTLLSDLSSAAILSATGTHWEEEAEDVWNWNTDTRTTAIILSVVSQLDAANPLNANAARWLMSSRTDGHWQGTQETAWTLMGLTNWMVASGELQADYEYAVGLNDVRLGGGTANGETLRDTLELRVDVGELLTGEANRLAIARQDGPGNLYYTAHLNLYLPADQVQALDRGMVVSRSYYHLEDRTTPVTEAAQGDLLLVRLTIVAPSSLHFVVVDDPLPAGLEAVDQSLKTSPQAIQPEAYKWSDLLYNGWGWWFFNHAEMRDERVVISADYLPAGTYVYTYLARASTPGTFQVIPTTAQEFYFPEVYGRSDGSSFTVNP